MKYLGEMVDLDSWARDRGLKVTHVMLARGRVRSQPMLILAGSGTLGRQLASVSRLTTELAATGFAVTRVKVEAARSRWAAEGV
jgi:hypothetical protein